jgi:hypothetical protein
MKKEIPDQYRIVVYDLADPLTMIDPMKDGQRYGVYDKQPPLIINRGQRFSIGRPTNQNSPDIKLNHIGVSRGQGEIYFDRSDEGVFPGVVYRDTGRNKPIPSFKSQDVANRLKFLKFGGSVRIYSGEKLRFANALELAVEEIDGGVNES